MITDINLVPDIVTDKNVNDVYVLNTYNSSLIPAPNLGRIYVSYYMIFFFHGGYGGDVLSSRLVSLNPIRYHRSTEFPSC